MSLWLAITRKIHRGSKRARLLSILTTRRIMITSISQRRNKTGSSSARHYQITPQFGNGQQSLSRHLDGKWLPKPTTTANDHGVAYRQCTFVAPSTKRLLKGLQFGTASEQSVWRNTRSKTRCRPKADAKLNLAILRDAKNIPEDCLRKVPEGFNRRPKRPSIGIRRREPLRTVDLGEPQRQYRFSWQARRRQSDEPVRLSAGVAV